MSDSDSHLGSFGLQENILSDFMWKCAQLHIRSNFAE
jgi:hypothetical protein